MELSVLNLAPLREGQTYKEAIDASVRLAQKVEKLGYKRYWVAEHHNTKSVASSATQLLIQHTLSHTKSMRIGSGGMMLPNHSPYLLAEQFGMLETLYPNRVDLGLGRAPGTDMATARAIRRSSNLNPDFLEDIHELAGYFHDTQAVSAYPAAGLSVPFYILGSSTDSAYLASELGLPYAFASHFAPKMMREAVEIYRRRFKPSEHLQAPYVILGANAIVADTDEEAARLATTQTASFLNIVTGQSVGLVPPFESDDAVWQQHIQTHKVPHFGPIALERASLINNEKEIVRHMTEFSFIGSPQSVEQQIRHIQSEVDCDELMLNSYIYDETAQHYSYDLMMRVCHQLNQHQTL